jgi:hypothetical protein
MQSWASDITLTREEAARLVERQFPELAPASLAPLGTVPPAAAHSPSGVAQPPREKLSLSLRGP